MQDVLVGALVLFAMAVYVFLMLRRFGIGRPGGRPDCGCGSGSNCDKESNPTQSRIKKSKS